LLLLIDEFASLKRLPIIEEALAFIAGYGIKAYLIVQDLQQIRSAYGRDEGLIGNCHIRIAYSPNKIETAELLSRMVGQTTVVRKQTSVSGLRPGSWSRGTRTESMQEIQRPLITADEVMRLPSATKDEQGNVNEFIYNKLFDKFWKLAEIVPVDYQWARILWRIYHNIHVPIWGPFNVFADINAVLER